MFPSQIDVYFGSNYRTYVSFIPPVVEPENRILARVVHDPSNPDWPTGNRLTDPVFQENYPDITGMTAEVIRMNDSRALGGLNTTRTDRNGWVDFEWLLNPEEKAMKYLHSKQAYYNTDSDPGTLSQPKWSITCGGNVHILKNYASRFWQVETLPYVSAPKDMNAFNPWKTPEFIEYQTVIGYSRTKGSYWVGCPILTNDYPVWCPVVEDAPVYLHEKYVELFPTLPMTVLGKIIVRYLLRGPNVYGLTSLGEQIALEEWGFQGTEWKMKNVGTPANPFDFLRWM